MNQEVKTLGIFGLITAVLLIGGVIFLNNGSPKTTQNTLGETVYQINSETGHKTGNENSKIVLVEFSDYECPACASADPVVKNILNKYSNNIQFIYKNYPLPQHKNAVKAANAAESAADQNKFWEMKEKLFSTQQEWASLADPTEFFANLAKDLGLDEGKVREAVKNNQYTNRIQADFKDGQAVNVNATPTFYLNGKKLNFGNFSDLEKQIQKAVEETSN